MNQTYQNILKNIENHTQYRSECINLIASENIMSPMTRKAISSDMGNRYTIGTVDKRWFPGLDYYDGIERSAICSAKKLLHAEYVNVQPISGMVANMAVYSTLLKPGDLIMSLKEKNSGHYSHDGNNILSLFNVKVEYLPFSDREYSIDIEKAIIAIKNKKPRAIIIGAQEFLFPLPLKELRAICNETNTKIVYDASHVSGLIAGQTFQNPLSEGADFISMSTNKTLAAPDHGLVACRDIAYQSRIEHAITPLLTSNHHAHHVTGLAITLAEFEQFGHAYATQVIKNAQTLAKELFDQGVAVLCPHKNFTESHTVLFDAKREGKEAMRMLEKVNIITNSFSLPWNNEDEATGIRIGTNEVTRLGMKEKEMKIIARFIAEALHKQRSSRIIKNEVMNFREAFQQIYYCFN